MERRHLMADLEAPIPDRLMALPVRRVTEDDAEALAVLMLDAYAGTIDTDGTETIADARAEVAGWLSGASVPPVLEHSYVIVYEGEPVSAVLASRVDGLPFIAYAYTAAAHKGRGLSSGLMTHAMRSIRAAGERRVHLWVTVGNVPAEQIYERLGFTDVSEPS